MTPLEVRPRRLTLVCRVLTVVVLVLFAVLATLLSGNEADGQVFGLGDQLAFFGIGVLLAGCVLLFTRSRVRADDAGLWVRNVLGERFFAWQVVVGIHLPEGAPWAQLELHDDETVALLALQAHDGRPTVEAILALRRLLNDSRGSSA